MGLTMGLTAEQVWVQFFYTRQVWFMWLRNLIPHASPLTGKIFASTSEVWMSAIFKLLKPRN
jgi:hypothetical protein